MSNAKSSQFQLVRESGWKRGLSNLLQGEYSTWFNSSRWWKHSLMWLSLINVMMLIMILVANTAGEDGPPVLFMYGVFGGLSVAVGVMIIMQRVIIGEKKSGTAAWILSKPVTRTAYVVARLAGNSIAILVTAVIIPGIVLFMMLGLLSGDIGWLTPLGFALAVLMTALNTFFWITLVLMMGTITESSSTAIAVPMVLFFPLWLASVQIPGLIYISPLLLIFSPDPEEMNSLAFSFMTGESVFSWLPLIATVVFSVAFIAISIRRFNRQEF